MNSIKEKKNFNKSLKKTKENNSNLTIDSNRSISKGKKKTYLFRFI